ncbi:malto-oligosyltrehalose trehalohydrolase [Pedobacter sp. MC2016-14]|uniref:malto-oligosyltrehalose trehalohydrolase n=1 Tax=Pedobacter sp. MC2016-14 TaxID=2897327 RepID=UPI001E568978|nr:malto-oligosyltrehalose trehalohydrolase [Pedobacter sp. MC2016-14]MCD0489741.1 malto-oligosyltrehalose trehalohydrolase [Pedobacter sp. MC2016-14]
MPGLLVGKSTIPAFMVNYSFGTTHCNLWAPYAQQVALKFEKFSLYLDKGHDGEWLLNTDLPKPGDRYLLMVDTEEFPDPMSLCQPEGVHGASQIVDLAAFSWTDQHWTNPELNTYIIYELHAGTFSTEGTFAGIADKLDHLVDLGITAIELMPVCAFPGERNWGYDGVYPFAVHMAYGGPEGLQQLVNCCHEKGLAVILDVVYNHVGPEGNHFDKLGPFFTDKYKTPWGSAINYDDEFCDGLRNAVVENVLMWFRDFHIDALRLDAVHAIKDFSAKHLLLQLRAATDSWMQESGKCVYLMVESDLNDTRFIDVPEKGGFGMDAQWLDEFHHALRVTSGEPATGYYEDFKSVGQLAKAYRDAYVYDGIYSPHRKKIFGNKAQHCPGEQFIVFAQNHDQVGNRKFGERNTVLFSFELQKLMAAAVLCSPFLPMLFMGEEWGETNPFLYFISHTDPELIKAVQQGRAKEFAAFHADGETPDPQSELTFNQSKLDWEKTKDPKHLRILNYYKALIALRKEYPALGNTDRTCLEVVAQEADNCLTLTRWKGSQRVVCLLNFSHQRRHIELPGEEKNWIRIFDSAAAEWGAAGDGSFLEAQSILIYVNPNSYV